ncbi:helix-turn-helix domain-containing protein [Lactococcus lactis]|uniref:helix-turn-helix domain-containing protein n=1 Tax=Lactococcus lactis TaxID=1358 RepID=UPI00288F281E|nr:helix-turn-helix domain-containing protein [Lactococcus lactis]MDT2859680.1 helix-turn-helix domain-containing protein [Lactococcus lactis]
MSIISERIKQTRKNLSMTMNELAESMNVTQATIVKWENGTTTPRVNKIELLAKSLNVDTGYLLGTQDVPKLESEDDEHDFSLIDVLRDDELSITLNPFPGTGSYENKPFSQVYKAYRNNPEKRHLLIEIADLINQHKE